MRVLLINPPFYRIIGFYNRYFPLAITIIATVLKKAGHEVMVYNADLYKNPQNLDYSLLPQKYPAFLDSLKDKNHPVWNEVAQTIRDFQPELIGISMYTTFAVSAFQTAKMAKDLFPDCPLVVGGPHATSKADEILKIAPFIDFVIKGEGAEPMVDLAYQLHSGLKQISAVEGLSYRKDSQRIHNPEKCFSSGIDDSYFPDRSLLLNEKMYNSEDMGLIMSTIGCPYNCTFCASHIKKVKYRSVDDIIKEIKLVKEKYGTTQFTFKDDSFTLDKKRVYELCNELIRQKIKICWECNTRVNLVDEDLLKLMKRAGCNYLKIGIESGSDRILSKINKGISCEQSRAAAKVIQKSGIHWSAYFLIGLLGETKEDIYKTLDFMYELKPDLALLGVYENFPGTQMFQEGIDKNIVKPDMSLDDFYTTPPNLYYLKDPHVRSDVLGEDEFRLIENDVKEKFHRYNKRLRNILKTASAKFYVYRNEPKILFEDVKKFFRYI
jgi:anaerobic magnesium-protoporphyrin IX monomethyl ester cyclase